jgi:hypothetical protein
MTDLHAMGRAVFEADYQAVLHGEFSESVSISRGNQQGSSYGIFDIPYQELDLDTNTVVSSNKPRVTIWTGDFSFQIDRTCLVTARENNYKIYSIEDNGEGAITLWLEKV